MHPLRQLRHEQGYTQPELARRAKLSVRTICTIEKGRSYPRATTRRRLLRALGLAMADSPRVFPR
jgi:transcriptional regulator with XRE-family HTH domain